MIAWQGIAEDYGPKSHIWEHQVKRNPDGTPVLDSNGQQIYVKMEGILTEEQFKKKYGLLAKYECMECKYRFETKPGPLNCFKCGYIWVKWLNWEECLRKIDEKL